MDALHVERRSHLGLEAHQGLVVIRRHQVVDDVPEAERDVGADAFRELRRTSPS